MYSTCLAHLDILDLITLMILSEGYHFEALHYVIFSVHLLLPLRVCNLVTDIDCMCR
jgi:hypothetical protein